MTLRQPLTLAAALLLARASAATTPPPGFTPLWNGRDLAGWWGCDTKDPRAIQALAAEEFRKLHDSTLDDIHRHWSVRDGELVNDGKGLFLTSDASYGDFELLLDYRIDAHADSGVYLRGCPQVQIWDTNDATSRKFGAEKGSGALWNNAASSPGHDPLVLADRPVGEWNHLRVILAGSRTWVWLNDKLTVDGAILENYFDRKSPIPRTGPIQLQTHGGATRWKNVFVRPIAPAEADKLLRGTDPAGFESVFNGKDFTGWTGPLDCCRIEDSAIIWQPHKGGVVHTARSYGNFRARFEFKLPRGGNNGLALRYPGSGDTAYTGMCECQVLDDDYEAHTGQKIDPRQAHGSAYGMVAAKRGYQHPIGEWNYEEVTVRGSVIDVELNGTPILHADLSQVHDFLDNKQHPGKDRTEGFFGFAGHGDPVSFRNISIQPLP